ncbi:glycosyltransferase family 4 protein [Methanosaeta sp. UBA356]|jgi:glycosyltransferase involved in cell wall biosynthesis|uniref:glycosyltransferase family 4 protein n=1 Tax=Methanosaeta sp. UBA356 TaxID=1915559 RepID=UPI00257C34D8|nr:glycosyltransferase family 4 protein [Methanosaeta sp. UBA356]
MEIRVGLVLISNEIGGAETIVLNIAKKLTERSIKTYIITNQEIIKYFKDIEGLETINIGSMYTPKFSNSYLRNGIVLFRLLALKNKVKGQINSNYINLIHIHLPISMILYKIIKDGINAKSVFTIHGVSHLDGQKLKGLNFFKRNFILWLTEDCDHYTSACNYFIDVYKRFGVLNDNYSIIPNGINLDDLSCINDIDLGKSFKLLYSGGSRYAKGGDIVIEALYKIRETIPNIKLYVLRDIPENHFMRKYVKENGLENNVIFTGYMRPPEYYQYIKSSDIVILPSRTEGIAASLLEDMAFCKPIVATNVGGTPELIKDGVNGLLTSVNWEDIAEKVVYLYENRDVRNKISYTNCKYVKRFDWDKIIDLYIDLYKYIHESANR